MSDRAYVVGVGDALRDEPAPEVNAAPEQADPPVAAAGHLCSTCTHARICAVAIAIRSTGAEGDIAIGRCGSFQSAEDELYPEDLEESEPEK